MTIVLHNEKHNRGKKVESLRCPLCGRGRLCDTDGLDLVLSSHSYESRTNFENAGLMNERLNIEPDFNAKGADIILKCPSCACLVGIEIIK